MPINLMAEAPIPNPTCIPRPCEIVGDDPFILELPNSVFSNPKPFYAPLLERDAEWGVIESWLRGSASSS